MTEQKGNDTLIALGKFFHNYRVGRGLTLDEVSGDWSAATLSRFERGVVDISTDKAIDMMLRLGIDELDFLNYYENNPANFPLEMQEQVQMNDISAIDRRERAFFKAHTRKNNINTVARILFDASKYWPDAHYKLRSDDEQVIADLLVAPERFGLLELEIYKAIIGAASHELLTLLWSRTMNLESLGEGTDYRQLPQMESLLIWLGALMNRDMPLVNKIERHLSGSFNNPANYSAIVEFFPNWQYGRAVATWLRKSSRQNEKRVYMIIGDLRVLNVETDARWFELMFAHTKNGVVHHNYSLTDNHRKIEISSTPGEVLRQQRHYFNVGVDEIAGESSGATIRRFEAGETSLSFASLVHIGGKIGLLVSQMLTMPNATSPDVPGSVSLRAAFKQISIVSGNDKAAIIHRFVNQIPDKPVNVLATERMVLNAAAGIGAANDTPIQVIFKHMMQMNQWGSLETHSVIPLSRYLEPNQLELLLRKGWRVISKNLITVGVNYYFSGLVYAIERVVNDYSLAVVRSFLSNLKWLLQIDDPSPMRWRAVGLWTVARYIVDSGRTQRRHLETFVHQSMRVGHPDVIVAMRHAWPDKLPAGIIDEFVASFQM